MSQPDDAYFTCKTCGHWFHEDEKSKHGYASPTCEGCGDVDDGVDEEARQKAFDAMVARFKSQPGEHP